MKFARKVLLAKIESVYGQDPVPVEADNTMLVRNLVVRPLVPEYERRDVVRPYYSNEGQIVTGKPSTIEFDVEVAGSGAAGTAPKYGPLLKACGLSETVNVGTSVVYAPVSTGESSVALYYRVDGRQHKILGARGSFSLRMSRRAVPMLHFALTGLHVQPTDVALGTPVFTGWIKPVAFNKANTTTFTLHGFAAVVSDFAFEQANQAPYRNLPNSESVPITGRLPTGRITFEDTLVATKDWYGIVSAMTTGALAIVHGPATNQVKFDAPAVQLTNPDTGDDEGMLAKPLALDFQPSAGDDEFSITVL